MSGRTKASSSGLANVITNLSGTATQGAPTTSPVTLNTRGGLITMAGGTPVGGGTVSFTLNNSLIRPNSQILAWSTNTRTATKLALPTVTTGTIALGSCVITVGGDGANATAAAPIIQFLIM